ncbi:5' nucleotidase family protein [Carpediemonas membranifera]|uniref:5' nucleotidase family protein n=1 Tax=Carpediemonas membranifera TaxID=201153 RepID=A0A8J6B3K8_9EUKA|nr:5' nucleotidase family protein [Carpediemonas membranifera]|eukprot:KAG9392249.1 5' nucleotidase family protein [Carpediemonas membranifera]
MGRFSLPFARESPFIHITVALALGSLLSFTSAAETSGTIHLWQTSDIHGWIDGHVHTSNDATVATFLSLIERVTSTYEDPSTFLLFDSGDQVQGTGLSDATEIDGEFIFHSTKALPYTGMTVGNHELGLPTTTEYIHTNADAFATADTYITTNSIWGTDTTVAQEDMEPLGQARYKVVHVDSLDLDVLVLGWIYNFGHAIEHAHIVDAVATIESDWFKGVLTATKPDLIVHMCHISSDDQLLGKMNAAMRAQLPHTPMLYLTGHSHQYRHFTCALEDGSVDSQCLISEPMCYLYLFTALELDMGLVDVAGTMMWQFKTQPAPAKVEFTVADFAALAGVPAAELPTEASKTLEEYIDTRSDSLGLSDVLGCAPRDFFRYQAPDGHNSESSFIGLFQEGILPDVVWVDDDLTKISVINRGMLRANMYEGAVSLADIYTIMPFSDSFFTLTLNSTEVGWIMDLNNDPDIDSTVDSSLAHYILSVDLASLDEHTTYTLMTSNYDATVFAQQLSIRNPAKVYEATVYSNAINSFDAVKEYVTRYMACSLPSAPGGLSPAVIVGLVVAVSLVLIAASVTVAIGCFAAVILMRAGSVAKGVVGSPRDVYSRLEAVDGSGVPIASPNGDLLA